MGTARRITAAGLVLLLLVAGLVLVLRHPGGPLTLVSTFGASMQPTIAPNTLVVVRATGTYEVGDIAAYTSEQLDTVVLHRVVEMDGDRYVFKGDGNDWLDPERPTHDQLIGTAWLALPSVGGLGRMPTALAGLAVLLGVLLIVGTAAHRRRDASSGRRPARTRVSPTALGLAETATVPAAIALAAALALGVVAFVQPPTEPGPVDYTQQGEFSYSGDATAGLAYPDGTVATGDPVYLHLVDGLDVTFTYHLLTAADHDLSGRGELAITVSDGNGWQGTLPGAAVVELDSSTLDNSPTEFTVTIDPDEAQALLAQLEDETGVPAASRQITARAHIELAGVLAGAPLETTFAPSFEFTLDERRLRPTGSEHTPSESDTVTADGAQQRELEAVGLSLSVAHARVASPIAAAAALLVLALAVAIRVRARNVDELTLIKARLGDRVVDVADVRPAAGRTVVEVDTMGALANLAGESPIMHRRWGGSDTLLADDGSVVYWYEAVRRDGNVAGEARGAADELSHPAEGAMDAADGSVSAGITGQQAERIATTEPT